MGLREHVEKLSDKIGEAVTDRTATEPLLDRTISRVEDYIKSKGKKITIKKEIPKREMHEEATVKRVIGASILFLIMIASLSLVIYAVIIVLSVIFDELGYTPGLIAACALVALVVGIVAFYIATTNRENRKEEEEIAKRMKYERS